MACYFPWTPKGNSFVRPMSCGQCIGCRLEQSRQWAVRIVHESKLYDENCFLLLTYRDFRLSLDHRDFQLFMKRLRKHFAQGVRFFMAGEYGDVNGRPHYHVCLFNCNFPDRKYLKKSPSGANLYTSEVLNKLWGFGHCSIGNLTFESAAYAARYCTKKLTGDGSELTEIIDPDTGEMWLRAKEYARMSLKPGIGARWLEKYWSDVYPHGTVHVRGHEARPPRYYDKVFKARDAGLYMNMQSDRRLLLDKRFPDTWPDRLASREAVDRARLKLYK